MNDKKSDECKVSWGSWKDAGEILVHIVLAICIVYAVYSFFHQREAENDNAEKTKAEEVKNQEQASEGRRVKLENLEP